ncbi:MaoC family dehydratase [Nocardioides hwasunensis]|uniref:MaoC family dehydratase n=1 Tax=Nocardioides hwasunensis TaxID=397258 RepID=A0ABR8MHP9_9ACTN|nr:MaoC family dehydratase [Nocardioides hwasunensis]MBD3915575.1 MaoC family dehydratase [Nocardioides hwasunensis]
MSASSSQRFADRWFDEYAVGQAEPGGSAVVGADDIADFARISHDDHPAHTDPGFAEPRFGGLLAHGVLTFSVVVGLTMEPNRRAVAYGYDRIRFPGPVLAGDTITATSEVVEVAAHPRNPAIGLVTKAYTGTNQDGRTVVVCRHVLAVDVRPQEAHA